MKRFIVFLTLVCMGALAGTVLAGDYHTTTTLICSDCHNMHSSQTHSYNNTGGTPPQKDVKTWPWVSTGHEYLLFGDVNETCLNCHDGSANGPDVYGTNTGMYSGATRQAGGLNGLLAGHPAPGGNYTNDAGHTLGSMADPPGKGSSAYVPSSEGLECTSCHAQHGSTTQYRNLLSRGIFGYDGTYGPRTLTYLVADPPVAQSGLTGKDVAERVASGANHYVQSNIDFYEPFPDSSRYAQWCKTCHMDFHGSAGGAQLGGTYGGYKNSTTTPWLRHPTNGVNLGGTPSFVAQLSTYQGRLNKVKMMDSQALWTGVPADSTLTPSCFSCHKGHGNENPFGLIYMSGTGTINDNGDDGVGVSYKSLCKQCHVQG
jgi:hypothetical protein